MFVCLHSVPSVGFASANIRTYNIGHMLKMGIRSERVSVGWIDTCSPFSYVGLLIVLRQNQCQCIPFYLFSFVCDVVVKMWFFIFPYQTVGVFELIDSIDGRDAKRQLKVL